MKSSAKGPNPVEEYLKKIVHDSPTTKKRAEKTIEPQEQIRLNTAPTNSNSQANAPIEVKYDPKGKIEDLNTAEKMVTKINRDPIGLIFLYLMVIGGLALSFIIIALLMPAFSEFLGTSTSALGAVLGIFMIIASLLSAVFLFLATKIYRENQLIVTDTNVTQVLRIGLFSRKVSEVTMANVEDVSAHKYGVLQTIFNYGEIIIETAGEQNNFIFKYTPNPSAHAKVIQDARSEYLRKHRSTATL